jgi:rhodanese-related sulfurtransferase
MVQLVQRGLLILVLGTTLGLLSNALSPKGIPLITPPKMAPKAEEFIPLHQAHELWGSGNAFFLDARNPEDFEGGHIANALNLPAENFEQEFVKLAPMLPTDSPLVLYCDGTECELSHRLRNQLRQSGYTNAHILFNGWTAWSKAGYPVQKSAVK